MRAPSNIYANGKVIFVALPPQNWLVLLADSVSSWCESHALIGMPLERPLVLQWWAILHAAAHSPAGFDQEVTELREDVERIMGEQGQPPLTAGELATLQCVVHVRGEGDRLYPGMSL